MEIWIAVIITAILFFGIGWLSAVRHTPRTLAKLSPEQLDALAGKVWEHKE